MSVTCVLQDQGRTSSQHGNSDMSVSVTSECYKFRGGPQVTRSGEDLQLQGQGRTSSYKVRRGPQVNRQF